MAQPQPPFSALRALEAAARHRSFTHAARELRVTHSAVSQAVRRLEAEVGARLFDRRGGAMEPSAAALRLAQTYSAAAEQLSDLIREIRGDDQGERLVLGLPRDLEADWMAGRETRLAEALPDVEVTLAGAGATSDVELLATPRRRAADHLVAPLVVHPLGAPALLEPARPGAAADVLDLPLLAAAPGEWTAWTARHAPGARPRPTVLGDAEARLAAALAGEGLALVEPATVRRHLLSGALQALPFPVEPGSDWALRSHAGPKLAGAVERLALWLRLEFARDASLARRSARRG